MQKSNSALANEESVNSQASAKRAVRGGEYYEEEEAWIPQLPKKSPPIPLRSTNPFESENIESFISNSLSSPGSNNPGKGFSGGLWTGARKPITTPLPASETAPCFSSNNPFVEDNDECSDEKDVVLAVNSVSELDPFYDIDKKRKPEEEKDDPFVNCAIPSEESNPFEFDPYACERTMGRSERQ